MFVTVSVIIYLFAADGQATIPIESCGNGGGISHGS